MSDRPSSLSAAPTQRTAAKVPSEAARRDARSVTLSDEATSVASIIRELPDPADLPPGTLVLVPGTKGAPSMMRSLLSVFGRSKGVPRAVRCSALVARGYVNVGAAEDEARVDLAFGYVPPSITEPC